MTVVRWLMRSQRDVPDDDAWLSNAERRVQQTLRFEARRRDWRLGRWTAKDALRRSRDSALAELPPEVVSILADEDGAPTVLRDGVRQACSLSISHRDGWALAVVGDPEVRLGCDLEIVEPRSRAFVEDYFTAGERHRIDLAGPEAHDRLANLVWSAKESAVKALRTGLRVDTRTADVHLELRDEESGWRPLRVCRAGEPALEGWWREDGRRLATLVAMPAPNRPVRLVSPSCPWPVQHEPARSA